MAWSRRSGRRWLGAGLVLVALAVAARALLPVAIERYVNGVLDRERAYQGRVEDVDLALWRGAYALDGVRIVKRSGRVPVPFFAAPRVDLSIHWRALLRGAVVGEIVVESPVLNVVTAPSSSARQTGTETDWRRVVANLFPLRIDRLEVRSGRVHFRDFHSDPKIDVELHDVELVAHGLTNRSDANVEMPASALLRARVRERGRVKVAARFAPLSRSPTFDLDGEVVKADLRALNDVFRARAGFDVQRGSFAVYVELLARNGRFDGYLKPFFEDVDVLRLREEVDEQSPLASLWELFVELGTKLFEGPAPEGAVATRIPVSGSVESPEGGFWPALGAALRHAFVEALRPEIERSVGRE